MSGIIICNLPPGTGGSGDGGGGGAPTRCPEYWSIRPKKVTFKNEVR